MKEFFTKILPPFSLKKTPPKKAEFLSILLSLILIFEFRP
jgi:hypothetical protein